MALATELVVVTQLSRPLERAERPSGLAEKRLAQPLPAACWWEVRPYL